MSRFGWQVDPSIDYFGREGQPQRTKVVEFITKVLLPAGIERGRGRQRKFQKIVDHSSIASAARELFPGNRAIKKLAVRLLSCCFELTESAFSIDCCVCRLSILNPACQFVAGRQKVSTQF